MSGLDVFGPVLCTGCGQPAGGVHLSDCPHRPGALGPGEVEQLDWLRGSDSVRLIDVGTIAEVLRANDVCGPGGAYLDPIDLAKAIIAAQTEAGLGTFVLDSLRTHIKSIADRARGKSPAPVLEPHPGRVWRYTSPADGVRVMVRHDRFWQVADVTNTNVWERDDSVPTWPGRFEIVISGD